MAAKDDHKHSLLNPLVYPFSKENDILDTSLQTVKTFGLSFKMSTEYDTEFDVYGALSRALKEQQIHTMDHMTWRALGIQTEPCHTCYVQWEKDEWRRREKHLEYLSLPWSERFINWCIEVDKSSCNHQRDDDYDY